MHPTSDHPSMERFTAAAHLGRDAIPTLAWVGTLLAWVNLSTAYAITMQVLQLLLVLATLIFTLFRAYRAYQQWAYSRDVAEFRRPKNTPQQPPPPSPYDE